METKNKVTKPSFREAFSFWLKLGFISFGGPAGQIAIMHEFLVEKKKWISESRFLHGLNYCMLLPGPEAQQLATYIGWLLHGTRGGLAAGILFILPSLFILLVLSIAYVLYGAIDWVAAMFDGLKPAVVAIVMVALFKIAKRSLLSPLHYAVAAGSFVCIFSLKIPFPIIIIASLLLGLLAHRFVSSLFNNEKSVGRVDDEHEYFLNRHSPNLGGGFNFRRLALKGLVTMVLWVLPIALFATAFDDDGFWITISTFFTKAALVTFGGAYAVLPYVAQVSVEKFGWLTELQMIDGLALGETTPGPLIMVLVFVGFMAGYNHGGASIADGTLGLLTTAYYTFLPCFFFIFAGAPIVETTKDNTTIKSVLSVVTAAVVGVILNLTIYLGQAVLFPSTPDWISILWLIVSFACLYKLKVNMIWWIAISAVAGLLRHMLL